MKIALLDIKTGTKMNSKFCAVNMRNFHILANELNADFIYSAQDATLHNADYDVIIVGFTSNNSDLHAMIQFVENNPKASLIMLVGEYEQSCCTVAYFTKRQYTIIRNYTGPNKVTTSKKYENGDYFVNLNLIVSRNANPLMPKKYDCIYYGRWRPNRVASYKKYLDNIYLSSSRKNLKMYKSIGCSPIAYLDKIGWEKGKETLNLFRYSLYIEDDYTHTHYNCLANRWYEAGICNNVVIFDADTENTIRQSEIGQFWEQIQPYIVHNGFELQKIINELNKDFEKHLAIQKSWRMAEPYLREEALGKIKDIIKQTCNSTYS